MRTVKWLFCSLFLSISAFAQVPVDSAAVAAAPQEQPLDSLQTLTPKLTELFLKARTDSNNAGLYLEIAREYQKIGRPALAVDYMDKSLQKDPTNMDVMYEKGEWLLAMGKKKSGYESFLYVLRDFKGQAYLDRIAPRFMSNFKITQITNNKFNDVRPSYSPDGKLIIFQSDRNGNYDIYTMNPDQGESSVKRLTDDTEADESPVYSPDGKWIVFTSTRDDKSNKDYKPREIYFMDRLGKRQTRVTSSFGGDNWNPIFVDTVTVAFASDRSDFSSNPFWKKHSGVYTIERNGSFLFKMLSAEGTNYSDPAFKAQTNQYIFSQAKEDGDLDLYITSTDIKEKPKNITNASRNDMHPHVSKDGVFVTFTSNRDGNYEIYRMQADGQDPVRITNEDADDLYPKFAPNGSKIVFCSNRTGKFQLFVASTEEGASVTVQSVISILEKRIASSSDN